MTSFFEKTKTEPEGWSVSHFDLSPGKEAYIVSTPKFKYEGDLYRCNLCGTKIVHQFYINHENNSISALIGSECIKKFLVGNSKDDFANKLKRLTAKESIRKLNVRIYHHLNDALKPFLESYEKSLVEGMPEVQEDWHYLLNIASQFKLSECGNYASVYPISTIKEIKRIVDHAKSFNYFDEIVTPEKWYDLNFERKKPLNFTNFMQKMHDCIEYCKSTNDPIKIFSTCYMYRFSRVRKECEILK